MKIDEAMINKACVELIKNSGMSDSITDNEFNKYSIGYIDGIISLGEELKRELEK